VPSFRSESDAFGFLLRLAAAVAPAVVAGALGVTWLAVALFVVALVAVAASVVRRPTVELRLKSAPAHSGAAGERRILVVASDTLGDEELALEIARLGSAPATEVLVLAPAVVSPWRRWTCGVDSPREQARARLGEALAEIRGRADAHGVVSDEEPLQAIEDALTTFAADEIVVATRRERPWDGLEPRLAGLVGERFALPVAHFVLDGGRAARSSA
jgi:hypothetical protein